MLLSKAIEGYLAEGQVRRKSQHTLSGDTYQTRALLQFAGDIPLEDLTVDMLREFLLTQQQRGIPDYTYHSYYKHLRALMRWFHREGLVQENLLARIPPPRLPALLPKVLTADQVNKLFAHLKRDTSPLGHRNRVIISTFLGTGIRSNELAHLKLEDVSLEGHYLMVREGKWGRQRPVPLGNNLRKYLWRYMNDWRNDLPARGAPYKRSASTRRRIFSGTPSRRCTCAPAETWSACG